MILVAQYLLGGVVSPTCGNGGQGTDRGQAKTRRSLSFQNFMSELFRSRLLLIAVALVGVAAPSRAGFIYDFAAQNTFQVFNTNADGGVVTQPTSFVLTGGNNGSLSFGTTDYTATATLGGTVNFNWSYSTCSPTSPPVCDDPTFDFAGYLINGNFFSLADTNGQSGTGTFDILAGDVFGFRVGTVDNSGEPGILSVSSVPSGVPEPATSMLLLFALGMMMIAMGRG